MVKQSLGGGEGSLIFSLLWVSRVGERGKGWVLHISCLFLDVYKRQSQVKIHKEGKPIRPIVSFINAPIYKLSKEVSRVLKEKYEFGTKYNLSLIHISTS